MQRFGLVRSAVIAAAIGVPVAWAPKAVQAAAETVPSRSEVAQQTAPAAAPPSSGLVDAPTPGASFQTSISAYFDNYFVRSDAAKASQPHWMTPLITVTPRLEQEFRYDQLWNNAPSGAHIDNFDGGKGLELIPWDTQEVILGVPPYEVRSNKNRAQGFGDYPFLLVKQRLLSANEQDGNYILTFFLQGVAATGAKAFSSHAWAINPTVAFGKGWGDFDVQATVGASFPTAYENKIGDTIPINVAFQYFVRPVFWPEFEVNSVYYADGPHGGKFQTLLTPGIIFGRFPLFSRFLLAAGVGYQFAISPHQAHNLAVPTIKNAPVLSVRIPF